MTTINSMTMNVSGDQEEPLLDGAQDAVWTDSFYEGEPGIIRVFDFDYDSLQYAHSWNTVAVMLAYIVLVVVSSLKSGKVDYGMVIIGLFLFSLLGYNYGKRIVLNRRIFGLLGLHVALTSSGIRYVVCNYPHGSSFHTQVTVCIGARRFFPESPHSQ